MALLQVGDEIGDVQQRQGVPRGEGL